MGGGHQQNMGGNQGGPGPHGMQQRNQQQPQPMGQPPMPGAGGMPGMPNAGGMPGMPQAPQ